MEGFYGMRCSNRALPNKAGFEYSAFGDGLESDSRSRDWELQRGILNPSEGSKQAHRHQSVVKRV